MEEGSLRCDANVSVRRRGATALGTRAEIKNLNSFPKCGPLHRARDRSTGGGDRVRRCRGAGNAPLGRRQGRDGFDALQGKRRTTIAIFPSPTFPPLRVTPEWVEAVRRSLPEMPAGKKRRFVDDYALPDYDAGVLTQSRAVADYYEAVASESGDPKAASNWGHERGPPEAQ